MSVNYMETNFSKQNVLYEQSQYACTTDWRSAV